MSIGGRGGLSRRWDLEALRHKLKHRCNLLARLDPRRIQAVGAKLGEGFEPADRLVEIGKTVKLPGFLFAGGDLDAFVADILKRTRAE